MAAMNLNLLAGLVEQMNRMTELVRLRKILHKKPEDRTGGDLERLMDESAPMGLLAKRGPAAHKDMCYGLHLLTVDEDETLAFVGLPGKGELYCMVMSGRIWVETENMAPFNGKYDDAGMKKDSSAQVTDKEMEDLFASIDADGSGAIDVEELSYALEMMGMPMSDDKVQELMDSVDDDGSGELDIDEFKLILKDKLGIGKDPTTKWETKDGKSSKYYGVGSVFGEDSVTGSNGPMVGKLVGIEEADICFIPKGAYHHILEHGFGGDLARKQELLRGHTIVQQCIRRSDLKRLAHACELHEITFKDTLCSQGGVPSELIFLCEGTCKVQERRDAEDSPLTKNMAKFEARRNIKDLRKDGMKQFRIKNTGKTHSMVDLAILQSGDLVSTNVMYPDLPPHEHTVVTFPKTTVLKLARSDLMSLLHPADLEALREAVGTISERRMKRSKTNAVSMQNIIKRTQSYKEVAKSMNILDFSSAGSGSESPIAEDLHEREAIIDHVVQTGAISGHAKSIRPDDVGEVFAADRIKEVAKVASTSLKALTKEVVKVNALSSNPRKLKEQLKNANKSAARLGQSRGDRWDKLQKSMSLLNKLKVANSEDTGYKLSLDEMVKGINAGKVSLDALLGAFKRMQSKEEAAAKQELIDEGDDVFEKLVTTALGDETSNGRDLSPSGRQTRIWTMGSRMELPPPPVTRIPREPTAKQSATELSKMLAPRPRQKAAHVESISVGKLGTTVADMAEDLNSFTSYMLVENDGMKPMPWRKDKPDTRKSQQDTSINKDELAQLNQVLTKTIEKGVNSQVMQKAGITVGHLKKLKQSIRVIMFLSRAKTQASLSSHVGEGSDENDEDQLSAEGQHSGAAGSDTVADRAASPGASVPRLNLASLMQSKQQHQPGPSTSASSVAFSAGPGTPDSDRGVPAAPLTGWATDRSVDGRSVRQVGNAGTTSLPVMPSAAAAAAAADTSPRRQPYSRSMNMSKSMSQLKIPSPGRQAQSMPPVNAGAALKPLTGRRASQLMQAPEEALSHNRDYHAFATHRPSAAPKETGKFSQMIKANPSPNDLYGIGFSPDAPSHWTPRGGRANMTLPSMPDTSWYSSAGVSAGLPMTAPSGSMTARELSSHGGAHQRARTGVPRPKIIMAGGWYTDRSGPALPASPADPRLRHIQSGKAEQLGIVRLNPSSFHAGAISPYKACSDGQGKPVLRAKCFNSRIK